MEEFGKILKEWLIDIGISPQLALWMRGIMIILFVILISIAANYIAKKIILAINSRIVKRTHTLWNRILFRKKVFSKLSHVISALVFYFSAKIVLSYYPSYMNLVQSASFIYITIIGMVVANSFMNASHEIYLHLPESKNRPIKGYIQVIKILIYFIGSIFILSIIIGKSPMALLAGFGAVAAILLVVFKDTITAFVSSIQLTSNEMLKPDDKIIMPKYNVDGDVMEIAMNTVKIRNFDQTILTISTNTLMLEPFTNVRGMIDSGSRLIRRSFFLDMKSIQLMSKDEGSQIAKKHFGKNILFNTSIEVIPEEMITNVSLLKKYIESYLKETPVILQEMKFIIRLLQPTDKGVPLEINAFCSITDDEAFENLISEITEHILAVIELFELHIFQSPSPIGTHSHFIVE